MKPALLLLLLALQAAPAAAIELKVATWNLDWLTFRRQGDAALPSDVVPKTEADRALLRAYADRLDADVVALQEVDGPEVAATLFPPDRYRIVMTGDRVVQRVGFAIRRTIPMERNPDLAGLDVQPHAVHPLRTGADVTLVLPGGRLRLLAVHLKTGCHERPLTSPGRNCETLARQVAPLQGWLRQRQAEGAPFVLLGDFNRVMDGRDQLLAALREAAPLLRATEGMGSPCWGGGAFIDHILAGGAARGWLVPGSLRVQVFRETDPAARDRLSDHCAVSARFELPD